MTRGYFELRKTAARGSESIAADVMRHLHTRQHLGRAVVISEAPVPMLSAARKQWLKLSRVIQKQRASTLNADKILKYTHTIAHMQRMVFTAKAPLEYPSADVYFLHPEQLAVMPVHCWTIYVLDVIPPSFTESMLRLLPSEALVVDYNRQLHWSELGLQPKAALEQNVAEEWQHVQRFLRSYDINIAALEADEIRDVEAMDDALDTLLGISHKFLQVANAFQRALELARPLKISKELRSEYDSLVLLAHRVQALSPGVFTQQFLETYNEDDTFFLYDIRRQLARSYGYGLSEAYFKHTAAGRINLARALHTFAGQAGAPPPSP